MIFSQTMLLNRLEKLKERASKIKFPKRERDENRERWRPTRTQVLIVAFVILILMIFFLFWLCDEQTHILNDWVEKRSYGSYHRWGWKRKALTFVSFCITFTWAGAIINEFAAYHKNKRTFYKLYEDDDYRRY